MTAHTFKRRLGTTLLFLFVVLCSRGRTQEQEPERDKDLDLKELRLEIEQLKKRDIENQREIDELEKQIQELQAETRTESSSETTQALDQALEELPTDQAVDTDIRSRQVGAVNLRFIELSMDLLFAVGSSSERDDALQSLQGGGHDPRKRGFTLQNLELSFTGAVDPYFTSEVHINYFLEPLDNESEFELEEAFLTTLQLPLGLHEYGFQVEAGHFFTEFGRINPQHPHQWDWLDQPVINTRLFGPDGMRGLGFRLGWLTPLPWFSEWHFGMQDASGETMSSFLANDEFFDERPIGGRPFVDRDVRSLEDFVYLGRWDNSWDFTDEVTTKVGVSGLVGPNATGPDGKTTIYGADFLLKWRPLDSHRGWPFVVWQSEIMGRDYRADDNPDEGLSSRTLGDWGLYTQVLYGLVRNWAVGIRYEYARGSGSSILEFDGRDEDPFRDDRHRWSPLIAWIPTEFSRIRLQYNYDRADHLDEDDAHSVWLGFEVLFGQHPAHTY